MLDGILNKTHVTNSHSAFGQLFWFSGRCVFGSTPGSTWFFKKKRFKMSVKLRLTANSARQLRGESPSPCRAPQTVLKRIIQNTSQKGPVFGHMGAVSVDFNQNRFENTRFR